jgi:nucleoid DNA-binding protein
MARKTTPTTTTATTPEAQAPAAQVLAAADGPRKPPTKKELIARVADRAGKLPGVGDLSHRTVAAVLQALADEVRHELARKDGPGKVMIPDLVIVTRSVRPATAEKQGVNPFTREPMTFKAKPARTVIKARPTAALTVADADD